MPLSPALEPTPIGAAIPGTICSPLRKLYAQRIPRSHLQILRPLPLMGRDQAFAGVPVRCPMGRMLRAQRRVGLKTESARAPPTVDSPVGRSRLTVEATATLASPLPSN